ncbi:MAG: restriction endonuclease subunit S [Ramlibacter sp.]
MSGLTSSLGDVADFINGAAFKPDDWGNHGNRIIRIQNLTDATKPYNRTTRIVSERIHVQPGDLLVSWSATLGVFEWNGPDVAYLNQHIFRVLPDERKVDKRYLRHALEVALLDMRKHLHGATMLHVNRGEFLSTKLYLPSLSEQRRIAAILDKADALRTQRREALAQLDRLEHSIFAEMFGQPEANSKGWDLVPLPEATDFQEGPGILAKDFRNAGIPLVRLAGMGGAEVSLRGCNFVDPGMFARKWAHFALREGDILVLTSASFGNPTVVGKEAVGALFYTGIIRFRPKGSDVDSTYLRHYLASPWFLRQATALASGAVIKHFGPTHLRQMTIPVPPLQLQHRFAERVAGLETLRTRAKLASAGADTFFASVQHQAFTGGLACDSLALAQGMNALT